MAHAVETTCALVLIESARMAVGLLSSQSRTDSILRSAEKVLLTDAKLKVEALRCNKLSDLKDVLFK